MTANLVNAAPFSLSPQADSRSDGLVCDLSLGEPRRQNFPAEICKSLLDLAAINHYYPAYGLPALRQNIQNRFYPQLNPADYMVFMTHGAIHGIDLLLRSALKPGEEILLPDPGFPPYQRLAELIGVKSRTYNLVHTEHGFAFDIESIAQALTPDTRVLVINSPHNPTGAMLRPEQIQQLGILLKDFPDLLLISDEVYSEIVYTEPHQTLAGITPRTYVVNSFSKTFSTTPRNF
ncbi:MAG: pyridoxal phosphate-dependent aminotransferase [Pseudobdellovibrionaceae bacterium]|nr:pyridoxal phosphate-dependent aminotransferase [Pseudobdellovibrionaceae bacterium]